MLEKRQAQRARTIRKILFAELILLSLPIMVDNLAFALFNLIDSYFLGKLGHLQLAAPGQINTLAFFLVNIGLGFSVAITSLTSQAKGREDFNQINKVLGHGLMMYGAAGFSFMLIMMFFGRSFLGFMRVPADILPYALSFLYAYIWGMPANFIRMPINSALRGVGDTKTVLYIHLVGILSNILLDALLIFGLGPFPELGVVGAGIATAIAMWIEAAILLLLATRYHRYIHLKHFVVEKTQFASILKIGMPSALGAGFTAFGFVTINGFINTFGSMVSTAYTLASRITNLFNMPGVGIGQGVAVMVGHSLGRGRYKRADRVVKTGIAAVLIMLIPLMSFMFFKGDVFIRMFTDREEVVGYCFTLLKFLSVSVILFNVFNVLVGAFNGGGDTKPVLYFNLLRLWGMRIPIGWVLSFVVGLGFVGFYWSMLFSNTIVFIGAYHIYKTGRWKRNLYIEGARESDCEVL